MQKIPPIKTKTLVRRTYGLGRAVNLNESDVTIPISFAVVCIVVDGIVLRSAVLNEIYRTHSVRLSPLCGRLLTCSGPHRLTKKICAGLFNMSSAHEARHP